MVANPTVFHIPGWWSHTRLREAAAREHPGKEWKEAEYDFGQREWRFQEKLTPGELAALRRLESELWGDAEKVLDYGLQAGGVRGALTKAACQKFAELVAGAEAQTRRKAEERAREAADMPGYEREAASILEGNLSGRRASLNLAQKKLADRQRAGREEAEKWRRRTERERRGLLWAGLFAEMENRALPWREML